MAAEWAWKRTALGEFPVAGGTYACIHFGVVCWLYFDPDDRLWHPHHGWRRKVGIPIEEVSFWAPLPPAPAGLE